MSAKTRLTFESCYFHNVATSAPYSEFLIEAKEGYAGQLNLVNCTYKIDQNASSALVTGTVRGLNVGNARVA